MQEEVPLPGLRAREAIVRKNLEAHAEHVAVAPRLLEVSTKQLLHVAQPLPSQPACLLLNRLEATENVVSGTFCLAGLPVLMLM